MQHCTLEQCIDSMWMLTMALFGSRLQGQECKRKTASLAYSRDCWYTSAELVHSILDLHCAHSLPNEEQITLFMESGLTLAMLSAKGVGQKSAHQSSQALAQWSARGDRRDR